MARPKSKSRDPSFQTCTNSTVYALKGERCAQKWLKVAAKHMLKCAYVYLSNDPPVSFIKILGGGGFCIKGD